jgi:hypothetical protein
VGVERKNAPANRIAVMVIVKKPAVERRVAQGGLDGVKIHTES